ncbi:hypothetical protein WAI453_004406 [Rhynchosporium graminicola]
MIFDNLARVLRSATCECGQIEKGSPSKAYNFDSPSFYGRLGSHDVGITLCGYLDPKQGDISGRLNLGSVPAALAAMD